MEALRQLLEELRDALAKEPTPESDAAVAQLTSNLVQQILVQDIRRRTYVIERAGGRPAAILLSAAAYRVAQPLIYECASGRAHLLGLPVYETPIDRVIVLAARAPGG